MPTVKSGYHHGDLRTALVDAGLHLTRTGGPEALTIREATRRVGVSPNATYRHFVDREALLGAVAAAIQHQMAERMAHPSDADAAGRLRAVGMGYITFALDEPGWFTVAFFGADVDHETSTAPPYLALLDVLDAMVADGLLSPDRRAGAEWPCWSAVHGFAELALRGPLRHANRRDVDSLAARTVDDIIAGLMRRA